MLSSRWAAQPAQPSRHRRRSPGFAAIGDNDVLDQARQKSGRIAIANPGAGDAYGIEQADRAVRELLG